MFISLLKTYNEFVVPTVAKIRLHYYHYGRLPYFVLFTLVKFLLWTFQKVWWNMNGVQKFLDRIYDGQCYELSAHVLTVIDSCQPFPFEKARDLWHYMTVHHSFQHPNCVLADDVMLVDVTYTKAVFVQFPHTLDHYTVKSAPFLFITAVTDAVSLIEIPLVTFHRLARKVGHPAYRFDNITFLFNIGRSGSTVVCRMIEDSDPEDTIVFSEPPLLFEFVHYMKYQSADFANPALESALTLLLKPMLGKKRVLIKPSYFNTKIAKHIHKILPKAKMLFIYRDHLRVIRAQERAFGTSPIYKLLRLAIYCKLWGHVVRYSGLYRHGPYEYYTNKYLKPTIFDVCVMSWAYIWIHYREQAELFEFTDVYYDNLLENPEQFARDILKLFSLPESRLSTALSVLNKDAQEGTLLSQSALRHITVTSYSCETKSRINKYCEGLNLPRLRWGDNKNNNITNVGSASYVKKSKSDAASFEKIIPSSGLLKPLPIQCVLSGE